MPRLTDALQKTLAVLIVTALTLTAPGLDCYRALAQAGKVVAIPGAGTGVPTPVVPNNGQAGGVTGQAGAGWDFSALRGGMGSRLPQLRLPGSAAESTAGNEAAPSAPIVPGVQPQGIGTATPQETRETALFLDGNVLTLDEDPAEAVTAALDAPAAPLIRRLTEKGELKRLQNQAPVEGLRGAATRDFDRLLGVLSIESRGELSAGAGIVSPVPEIREPIAAPRVEPEAGSPDGVVKGSVRLRRKDAVAFWDQEVALSASQFREVGAAIPVHNIASALAIAASPIVRDAVSAPKSAGGSAGAARPARLIVRDPGVEGIRPASASGGRDPGGKRIRPLASGVAPTAPARRAGLSAKASAASEPRSVGFLGVMAGITAAGWAVLSFMPKAAGWAVAVAGPVLVRPEQLFSHYAGIAGTVAMAAAGVFLLAWAYEAAMYAWTSWRGRAVTPEEFWAFVEQDARVRPALYRGLLGVKRGAGILKPAFEPETRSFGVFAYALPNAIYIRPELIRTPWEFRRVLKSQLHAFGRHLGRGPPPPKSAVKRLLKGFWTQLTGRLSEVLPRTPSLPPAFLLERALREAQVSLRLSSPYDVLLAGRKDGPIGSGDFEWLSEGMARVQTVPLTGAAQAGALAQAESVDQTLRDPANRRRFRAILIEDPSAWAPKGQDLRRLEMAFRRMELVYQERVARLRQQPDADKRRDNVAQGLWREIETPQSSGLAIARLLERLYGSMRDKGVVILPFGEGEAAQGYFERLFRHWAAADGGSFRTVRVRLSEGSQVLVAEKIEPRVRVWLVPANDKQVAAGIVNVYRDPVKRAAAESVVRYLGLEAWLPVFERVDLEYLHIQGADVGDTRLFVSLPKSKLRFIQGLVAKDKSLRVVLPEENFQPLSARLIRLLPTVPSGLKDSIPRQKSPQAWKLAGKGMGRLAYLSDTGVWKEHPDFEGMVGETDFVDEGGGDIHGHGTQTTGDTRGSAPEARAHMGKVFPRSSGASDGDIQASWAEAVQLGADVLNNSLGSPGSADSPLARTASGLTRKTNAAGEHPIVVASAGNSGSDDETIGQPSAGEEVISVAAATKGETDGIVDIALYSSGGFSWYEHGRGLRRQVLKPEITATGGNVNTPDEKGDFYRAGLISPRSKDTDPSPSDEPDGLHTRAAGTSMSGPQVAGAALVVKDAAYAAAAGDAEAMAFAKENIPFVVKMILMASAEDLRVPLQKQGAGFLDMEAAVRLAQESFTRAGTVKPWDWIARARMTVDAPRGVFGAAAQAAEAVIAKAVAEGKTAADADREAQGAQNEAWKTSLAAARPGLVEALNDESWLVRFYAAFAFMGLKDPAALPALSKLAVGDSDARVRQMALQAITETPVKASDAQETHAALKKAIEDSRADVRAYAAVALARLGDASGVQTLVGLAAGKDKPVRFTALWAMGRMGAASDPAAAQRLAANVRDVSERDTNRHVAIASLKRIAAAKEETITAKVLEDLLAASGMQELIITRSVFRFFQDAAGRPALRKLMASDPAKGHLLAFIERNRSASNKRGPLGDLVRLLARITGAEISSPLPTDPSGQGIPGVDENLGPIHLVVELPQGRGAAVLRTLLAPVPRWTGWNEWEPRDPALVQEFEAALASIEFPLEAALQAGGQVRGILKEGFVTLEVPPHAAETLAGALERKGFLVTRAGPQAMFMRDTNPASRIPEIHRDLGLTGVGVAYLGIDEGLEVSNAAFQGKILGVVNTSGEGARNDVTSEAYGHGTHTMNTGVGSQRPEGNPNFGRAPDAFVVAGKALGRMGGSMATVMEAASEAVQIVDDANAKLEAYWKAKDAGQEAALPEDEALQSAIKKGIRRFLAVMNLSLGGPGAKNSAMNIQLRRLMLANKAKVSVAAGNDGPGKGTANRVSPANEWSVTTVGALSKKDAPEFYSNEGTDEEPILDIAHYGGDVVMSGAECPFLPGGIVSALAAAAAEEMARCIVPHNGKPTDQAMSGTSMASPHNAGDDALALQALLSGFSPEEAVATPGLYLWQAQTSYDNAKPIAGAERTKVGAGQRDIRREVEYIKDRVAKDKAGIVAEALELHKKAVERDRREATQRWAPVGQAIRPRRPLWVVVVEALARPWRTAIARVSRRTASGLAEAAPTDAGSIDRARDFAQLQEVRGALSHGGASGSALVQPFVFHSPDGLVDAMSAGLEGYLWTKRELEAKHGPDSLLHHLDDSFRYLEALLGANSWTRALLQEMEALHRDRTLTPSAKNAALNALLGSHVAALQEQESRLDKASWAQDTRLYELFPRAYNLPGRRRAGPLVARALQKTLDLLERIGLRKRPKFFADFGTIDLWLIKRMGFDAVWTMGIHPIGVVGRWGTGGGSPYAIQDHRLIHPDLGTMEDYRAFVRRAHRMGLKVMADLVPNHAAMDSKLIEEHPEWFMQIPILGDPAKPPKGYFLYEHPRTGKEYWLHHGGYDSYGKLATWDDTVQFDYSKDETRRGMARIAREFMEGSGVDGYRVDMAYQLLNHAFARNWQKRMPGREFLEELAFELKTASPAFALIAEAYADHDALSRTGFDLIYNKSDVRRNGQEGFYDALVSRDPATLRRARRRAAFLAWQRGGAAGLQFSTNHDEPAPRRSFGPWMRAALMLSMLLPGAHLVYASQEIGYDRPAPHEPKSIPFSEPREVDWEGADSQDAAFHGGLFALSARIRRLIPQPEAIQIEPADAPWTGDLIRPRAGTPGGTAFAVLTNPSDREIEVRIDRPDLGITFAATLAAYDAVALSFPFASTAVKPSLRDAAAARYATIAKWMSFFAFFAFVPMMLPQIKLNWGNYLAGDVEALAGVSYLMMALGIVGNGLNFPVFLLSRNPWLIIGCLAGITTTWVAVLPLFLAHVVPAWLFWGLTVLAGALISGALGGIWVRRAGGQRSQ